MNYKSNNIVLKVILSLLQIFCFVNIYSQFLRGEYTNDFVSLLLMLIELIVLLNLRDLIGKKDFLIAFGLLCVILLIRLNILNGYIQFEADKYVGIIFVLISMAFNTYMLRNVEANTKEENKTSKNDNISDIAIDKYVRNKIMNLFNLVAEEDGNEEASKYIWITFSGLIAIVLFLGKFIIDIKNIFTLEYTFDTVIIVIYFILNIIFIVINFIKAKIVGCNRIIDFVEVLLFLLGANLFVFAQREYARFQILVVVAYLCSLYVMKTRDLIQKLEGSERTT